MGRLFDFWNFIRQYKYAVALIVFALILGITDENSLMMRYRRQVEIGNLQREIDKFQAQYDENTRQLEALEQNPSVAEKIARERYYMKRQGEDVFVFVEDDDIQARERLEKPSANSATATEQEGSHVPEAPMVQPAEEMKTDSTQQEQ